ncbi:hypothetical protein BY996DRAFT_8414665 [Phakopsora pachyrhizi]|nr:hypothetical protein BY996DRAFT_8414665 [Phakopsora pachyrhizi]
MHPSIPHQAPRDSQIVLSESDDISKIVDPKDSSQRQTIALLVNEKSVLNDQLESYQKKVEDLNLDFEKHQNELMFQMNFSKEELENSRNSINNLNSQLLDSNNLITALREEHNWTRSELQYLNQSQSNGTKEVIRDYKAKLRMKHNYSYAVDSDLSRLKDLTKPQDHQSREQAGALDQLNQVFKGLRNELDLKDQSSTLLSSQLEDLRILCINTQISFSPLSPSFMNPNQNCLSFDQRLILPNPAEKPGLLGRFATSLVAIGTLCSLNMLGPQLLSHVLGLKKAFNPTINGNEDQIRRLSKDSLGDGVDFPMGDMLTSCFYNEEQLAAEKL